MPDMVAQTTPSSPICKPGKKKKKKKKKNENSLIFVCAQSEQNPNTGIRQLCCPQFSFCQNNEFVGTKNNNNNNNKKKKKDTTNTESFESVNIFLTLLL